MNRTNEEIAAILHSELRKQSEAGTGYVGDFQEIDNQTTLDGHFDLVAVAKAILAK